MIWKVIDTRKPEIVVMSCEEEEEEEACLIRIKAQFAVLSNMTVDR
jgi:hypothetical protein